MRKKNNAINNALIMFLDEEKSRKIINIVGAWTAWAEATVDKER